MKCPECGHEMGEKMDKEYSKGEKSEMGGKFKKELMRGKK